MAPSKEASRPWYRVLDVLNVVRFFLQGSIRLQAKPKLRCGLMVGRADISQGEGANGKAGIV